MNSSLVSITIKDGIATIIMDDGQKNLISPAMIKALNAALDEAEQQKAVIVLTGREDIFSAGFDLKVLKTEVINAFNMLIGGFELAYRLLSSPSPVIIACSGHAIAMGFFLVLSGDYRVGVRGPFKLVANEVAIGLTMPHSAVEICRQRLKPAHFDRVVLLSETYDPDAAIEAGVLDQVLAPQDLMPHALEKANEYAQLDLNAHAASKLRMRKATLGALRSAVRADKRAFVAMGVKRLLKRG